MKGIDLMKFYLAIIQNNEVAALYTYDSEDAALAAYHTELAFRDASRTSTHCAILNERLDVIARESYYASTDQNLEPLP